MDDMVEIRGSGGRYYVSREHGTVAIGKRYGITNAAVGRIVRGEAYVG